MDRSAAPEALPESRIGLPVRLEVHQGAPVIGERLEVETSLGVDEGPAEGFGVGQGEDPAAREGAVDLTVGVEACDKGLVTADKIPFVELVSGQPLGRDDDPAGGVDRAGAGQHGRGLPCRGRGNADARSRLDRRWRRNAEVGSEEPAFAEPGVEVAVRVEALDQGRVALVGAPVIAGRAEASDTDDDQPSLRVDREVGDGGLDRARRQDEWRESGHAETNVDLPGGEQREQTVPARDDNATVRELDRLPGLFDPVGQRHLSVLAEAGVEAGRRLRASD